MKSPLDELKALRELKDLKDKEKDRGMYLFGKRLYTQYRKDDKYKLKKKVYDWSLAHHIVLPINARIL